MSGNPRVESVLVRFGRLCLAGNDPASPVLLFLWGAPLVTVTLILWAACGPSFSIEHRFVDSGGFAQKIDDGQWRTLHSDPRPDLTHWSDCADDAACPGNPHNPSLFAGSKRDGGHAAVVQTLRGKRYWIGLVLSRNDLAEWTRKGASHLLIGYVYGSAEVFADGKSLFVRDAVTSRLPITIDLPEKPAKSLYVAVRILHDMDEPFPDVLDSAVVNALQLEKYLRKSEFENVVRPCLVLGYNLALGLLFALMWAAAPRRQEFAGFSTYCLVNAAKAGQLLHLVWLHSGGHLFHRLFFILACYSLLSALFMALTIARLRTWYTAAGFTVLLGLPWLLLLMPWGTDQFFANADFIYRHFETPAYLLAAALILLQARLVAEKRGELIDPYREHKLYIAAFTFLALPFVHLVIDSGVIDVRSVSMSLMMLMVIQEYGSQTRALGRSPQSRYHQLATPVTEVPCVAVSLDLKNSERLFNLGVESGRGGDIVKELMQRLLGKVDAAGGVLLSSEGDSLIFMLPDDGDASLRRAVELCLTLHGTLKAFLAQAKFPAEFELRLALEYGRIKPVWNEMGSKQVPGWTQVGSSTVFVDMARMLEAESKLCSRSMTSIVLKPAAAQRVRAFYPRLTFESVSANIKHGRRLDLEVATLTGAVQESFSPDGSEQRYGKE